MNKNAYLLLSLAALFWAGNAVAGKLAIGHVSPLLLNFLRWAIAAAALAALFHPQLRRDWPVLRENVWLLLLLGAFGFTGFSATLYMAVEYTSVINVSIEQAAMPMLVFLANFLLFRMRVSWAQIAGFLLSIAGVAVTAGHGDLTRLLELQVNFGDALMLVGVTFYGLYTVALRFKPQVDWRSLMFALTCAAALAGLPFALWELAAGRALAPDATGWGLVAFIGLFPSLLSQAFYIRGVELIGSNRGGLFMNLVPIFGIVLSILIVGETLHAYHAVAMLMVFGGIWLAEQGGRGRTE